jgi:hypothetical protein
LSPVCVSCDTTPASIEPVELVECGQNVISISEVRNAAGEQTKPRRSVVPSSVKHAEREKLKAMLRQAGVLSDENGHLAGFIEVTIGPR